MEYHVLTIPVFPWMMLKPETLNDLITLIEAAGRLFSFKLESAKERKVKNSRALLSRRLPYVIRETYPVYNITEVLKKKAPEWSNVLEVEEGYVSNFAIETISSFTSFKEIFQRWPPWRDDYPYESLAGQLSNFLWGINNPFPKDPFCIVVVNCRIVLCDSFSELADIAKEYDLQEIEKGLYVGRENTPYTYYMFNFIQRPWDEIHISNPIVTVKPELLEKQCNATRYELGFLISFVHSIGKAYAISESISLFLAILELSSWYLDDIFKNFESSFCWVQRNFTSLEKDLYWKERELKSSILPLSRITTSPESVDIIQKVYGMEYIPELGSFFSIICDPKVKKYKIPSDELYKAVLDNIRLLSRGLTRFWKDYANAKNTWLDIRRFRVANNQLRLSLLGILASLIANLILRFF
jgi:hypothetical protein